MHENLMRLTKSILIKQYNINFKGGVVTNIGFKTMMSTTFAHVISVCSDKSPVDEVISKSYIFPLNKNNTGNIEDIQKDLQNQLTNISNKVEELMSPLKDEIISFNKLKYNWDYSPGIVAITLDLNSTELKDISIIYRTSIFFINNILNAAYNVMLRIFYNRDGLSLKGIDNFSIIIYIYSENKGYSKKYCL